MVIEVEKLTISVPKELIKLTDEIAEERRTSRSKVVVSCLKEMVDRRLEERLIEGYKATSKANLEFAESSIHIAREIVK